MVLTCRKNWSWRTCPRILRMRMNTPQWCIFINAVSVCFLTFGVFQKEKLQLEQLPRDLPRQFISVEWPWNVVGSKDVRKKVHFAETRLIVGKDTTRPNILMGANAQVALEYVCRESRLMEGNSQDTLTLKQESSRSPRRATTVWMSIRFVKISMKTRLVIH